MTGSTTRRGARARAAAALSTLVIGGLASTYVAYALLAPLPAVSATLQAAPSISTPPALVSLPAYGASAIGAADDSRLFSGTDLDTPRPIASITKVVTALVVLDAYPIADGEPGQLITLTATDARLRDQYAAMGGSAASAPAGVTVSQRQIIELMMVQSANNYAETLATWAFGSVDRFLVEARAWLDSKGLTTISVVDTTGFSPSNTASPRALLQLARIALDDAVVRTAAQMPTVTVPGVGTYTNRNQILGIDGVTGLKTGTLDEAGACLLFTAEQNIDSETVRVVGVVLGGPNHRQLASDVRALLASIIDDYHSVDIADEGQIVATYDAPWGERVQLQIAESRTTQVWGAAQSRSTFTAPILHAGIEAVAPQLTVRFGGKTVNVDLDFVGEFEGPDIGWRISRPLVELLNG